MLDIDSVTRRFGELTALDNVSFSVPDGAFTSRLATCKVGDTVYVEKTAYGYLTTSRFVGGSNLWLLATGTGIAPFLSILRDPAVWVQYEHIVLAYSVRQAADLAYRDEIAALPQHPLWAEQGHKLRFVPLITREQLPGALSQRSAWRIITITAPSAQSCSKIERAHV